MYSTIGPKGTLESTFSTAASNQASGMNAAIIASIIEPPMTRMVATKALWGLAIRIVEA